MHPQLLRLLYIEPKYKQNTELIAKLHRQIHSYVFGYMYVTFSQWRI